MGAWWERDAVDRVGVVMPILNPDYKADYLFKNTSIYQKVIRIGNTNVHESGIVEAVSVQMLLGFK